MRNGLVYVWTLDPTNPLGGRVTKSSQPLLHLEGKREARLRGQHVRVRNGGLVNEPSENGGVRGVPLGDAEPNQDGDFLFEPGRGGGRLDKVLLAAPDMRWRYSQASHFGEVNTYFHLDKIAAYVDQLLRQIEEPPLPQVTAVVNAHHAATQMDSVRDGVRRDDHWLPFQGGHYRLPSKRYEIPELFPLSTSGEIHLGPGRQLLHYGALFEAAGGPYRSNASHNAGIIYHEYGHHITRHTADFRANRYRSMDKQNNRKTALDEGFADYWAASILGAPNIWAWHHLHDRQTIHPRSLTSPATMADYDYRIRADPHKNGTIWAAALWDLRERLRLKDQHAPQHVDLLVLKTLVLVSQIPGEQGKSGVGTICRARESYSTALAAFLEADKRLYSGLYQEPIRRSFAKRGIQPDANFLETDRHQLVPGPK